MAKQQEAMIKTDLMKGNIISDRGEIPISFKALSVYYLSLPDVKRNATYKWKVSTIHKRFSPIFQNHLLKDFSSGMVENFRENRRQGERIQRIKFKDGHDYQKPSLVEGYIGSSRP